MEHILKFLGQNPAVPLFLILGLGLLVGKIRIAGVELGGVTGVLFVGLAFGHYGFQLPGTSLSVGFLLFIFCVGVQAGPQFVAAFKKDGLKYALLAVITAVTATVVAGVLAKMFQFPMGMDAGALAGALTSTPSLVAAQDAVRAGLKSTGGLTSSEVVGNLSSAYAVTYVFGLAGLVTFMALMPKLFRVDLAGEAKEYESDGGAGKTGSVEHLLRTAERPSIRAYRIDKEDLVNRDWADWDHKMPAEIQRVKRGNEVFTPDEDYRFQLGDIVSVVGTRTAHDFAREHAGPEVVDYDVLDRTTASRTIMVSSKNIAGKTISDMHFVSQHQCYLTQVTRSGVDIPRRSDLRLQLGDVLALTGPSSKLETLAEEMGYSQSLLQQTDLMSFAFGIAIGVVIGLFSFTVGGVKIGLGTAGGTMLAGILFGVLHSRKPNIARFPVAARNILMELGLLFFMANIAISAGAGIVETVKSAGMTLAISGVVITLSPVIVCFFVGRFALKMNGAILMGAITGAMTSTPALTQITKLAKSSVPTLGYVGTYAFANVLLAVAGTIIMLL
jgi:putative transport protein